MYSINPVKSGLAFGAVLSLSHLFWATAVALGWGPVLLNLILRAHFIEPVLPMYSFNLGMAVVLILFTASAGFVFGAIFGAVWNWLNKETRRRPQREHQNERETQMMS
ncbi:hypothetical protein [Devosia sp.]|uniref:hypothetical protein n=1 Tax=Devosia sp. TaxID=1871048 RepID=UPI002FC8C6B2